MTRGASQRPLRVAVRSQGCKVNVCDGLSLVDELGAWGLLSVPWAAEADVYVVNTCTVTATADRQNRQLVYQTHRRAPSAAIVVTGCKAQVAPDEVAVLPGVARVVPNTDKAQLAAIIAGLGAGASPSRGPLGPAPVAGRTRPYVKVADGCDSRCSYCIVPAARGPARSLPASLVLERLHELGEAGVAEAVLTGVDLGAWGHDQAPRSHLADLLALIEDEAPVPRVRLSSVEPRGLDEAMLEVLAGARHVCRHLHVPLQSGDDGVLAKMRRPYRRRDFAALCDRLHARLPDLCLGTDVICGFPGESAEAYARTRSLCADVELAYLHAFPFSPRPGTPAARLTDDVPHAEKKRRVRDLIELSETRRARFATHHVDRVVEVVVERAPAAEPRVCSGLTRSYLTARFVGPGAAGELARVRVERAEGDTLIGHTLGAA